MLEQLIVVDPETLEPVPMDGQTIGEVMFRGNVVMKGYLKNPTATAEAFAGGYFHSGDLAVCHPDGYIEIKDRVQGRDYLGRREHLEHRGRGDACIATRPCSKPPSPLCRIKNGERRLAHSSTCVPTPKRVSEEEIIDFCRDNMAHFKAPRRVVFGPLPKTSTGKIRKFELRERARQL